MTGTRCIGWRAVRVTLLDKTLRRRVLLCCDAAKLYSGFWEPFRESNAHAG